MRCCTFLSVAHASLHLPHFLTFPQNPHDSSQDQNKTQSEKTQIVFLSVQLSLLKDNQLSNANLGKEFSIMEEMFAYHEIYSPFGWNTSTPWF